MSHKNGKDIGNERRPLTSVTRRGFIKGAGLSAAGAVILDHAELIAQEVGRSPAVMGPQAFPIVLNVNGQQKRISVEPRTTLAEALRSELNLTGTKIVCDRGACSACTVMLDKTPVCSCMTLAADVGERRITTIEGLAQGENLHPVQAAFIAHDGLQCGFCTSGMVMSCAALLERNPHPTIADVKTAISGNICRCGTYPKVFEAALAASGGRRA